MKFGNWDESLHEDPEQIKRFERSRKSDVKPISVNYEEKYCYIQGSEKKPYFVTLDSCTCPDFAKRKLPCKHIYRLANELGVGTSDFYSGINKRELDGLMFTMPVDAQELLYDMCINKEATRFIFKKGVNSLPLITNGFCIEAVDNYSCYAEQMSCPDLRELINNSGLKNIPTKQVRFKTLVNWMKEAETEQLKDMQNVFTALELTPEAVELRNTITRRFEKRFEKETITTDEGIYYEDVKKVFIQGNEVQTKANKRTTLSIPGTGISHMCESGKSKSSGLLGKIILIFFAISFLPISLTVLIVKSERLKKWQKAAIIAAIWIVTIIICVVNRSEDTVETAATVITTVVNSMPAA